MKRRGDAKTRRHGGVLRTQIRNTKPEARNKYKIGPPGSPPCGQSPSFEFSNVQNLTAQKDLSVVSVIWILVIRICFGFRYSDFGFKLHVCLCGYLRRKADTSEERAREYA